MDCDCDCDCDCDSKSDLYSDCEVDLIGILADLNVPESIRDGLTSFDFTGFKVIYHHDMVIHLMFDEKKGHLVSSKPGNRKASEKYGLSRMSAITLKLNHRFKSEKMVAYYQVSI